MKITVLGAGLIGRTIAIDLRDKYGADVVKSVDNSEAQLMNVPKGIRTCCVDLSGPIDTVIEESDLVVCAVPGFLGYHVMKQIIEAKKNVVDISFFKENPFSLHNLAKQNGVRAIIDAGVAPGMCNAILGNVYSQMDSVDSYECYVGGLPVFPKPPFNYKSPFCPDDVIQEYLRPSRLVENGHVEVYPALSGREMIDSPGGQLEAFRTDGLRSLITTMSDKVPNMVEKTCRYPGHAELMAQMKELGFFNEKALHITTKMLKTAWKLDSYEDEFTFMRVVVKGKRKNKPHESACRKNDGLVVTYNLFDKYDGIFSSMARTTGFTVNACVSLILDGTIQETGVLAPEIIGQDQKVFDGIMKYLNERNVVYKVQVNYTED